MVCFLVRLLACVAAVAFPFPGGEIEQAGERRNASRVSKKRSAEGFRLQFRSLCVCFGTHAMHPICLFELHPELNF